MLMTEGMLVETSRKVSNGFVKDGRFLPYVFDPNNVAKILPVCGVCGKKFVCVTTMKRHLVTHTGDKPFACRICGKQYTQKGNLRVHERTHRNERPFECNVCHQRFYRKEPMIKHKWRQHGLANSSLISELTTSSSSPSPSASSTPSSSSSSSSSSSISFSSTCEFKHAKSYSATEETCNEAFLLPTSSTSSSSLSSSSASPLSSSSASPLSSSSSSSSSPLKRKRLLATLYALEMDSSRPLDLSSKSAWGLSNELSLSMTNLDSNLIMGETNIRGV